MIQKDPLGQAIQGFAPKKIVAITATSAWTPSAYDIAFRVGQSCNYYMASTGSGNSAALSAGAITVINKLAGTYTFDTTMKIEVM